MNKSTQPLSLKSIFGVLEPTIEKDLIIYHQTSIKNILDNFPIQYKEDLSELSWSFDVCCNGWFTKANTDDENIRAHTGCDNYCDKELTDEEWSHHLYIQIPNYIRKDNEVLEFLVFDDTTKWLVRVIPTSTNKFITIHSSLHISLYSR